jgi:hypothetical protein
VPPVDDARCGRNGERCSKATEGADSPLTGRRPGSRGIEVAGHEGRRVVPATTASRSSSVLVAMACSPNVSSSALRRRSIPSGRATGSTSSRPAATRRAVRPPRPWRHRTQSSTPPGSPPDGRPTGHRAVVRSAVAHSVRAGRDADRSRNHGTHGNRLGRPGHRLPVSGYRLPRDGPEPRRRTADRIGRARQHAAGARHNRWTTCRSPGRSGERSHFDRGSAGAPR